MSITTPVAAVVVLENWFEESLDCDTKETVWEVMIFLKKHLNVSEEAIQTFKANRYQRNLFHHCIEMKAELDTAKAEIQKLKKQKKAE